MYCKEWEIAPIKAKDLLENFALIVKKIS